MRPIEPILLEIVISRFLGSTMVSLDKFLFGSFFGGRRAPANPWGGRSLEWQCASPPPFDNFAKTPRVGDCYDFSVVHWDEKTGGYWVDESADPEVNPSAPPRPAH